MKVRPLPSLVQAFFTVELPSRGVSPLTILSYRDSCKLLLRFVAEKCKRPATRLEMSDLDSTTVRAFLDHLEQKRGNDVATRNNRLAAIRSFFTYAAQEEPAIAEHCRRVCVLPIKRAPVRSVTYLDRNEIQAVLAAPDRSTRTGLRDHALLLFLYNTGARVQETIDVRANDLRLTRPRQALLHGKGRKDRMCPLWNTTAKAIEELLASTRVGADSSEHVFRNLQGEPLTRFGVGYILKKHTVTASQHERSLKRKTVSPHVLRHTAAVHLLNSGVDLAVIRSWLGHVDLRTTSIYAEIDLETKRRALEACPPATSPNPKKRKPNWQRDEELLTWLERL